MKRNESRRNQRGATFLGVLIIVSILGLAVYAGIRLVPLYQEYLAVSRALTQTASKLGNGASPGEIRRELESRWAADYITSIQPRDIEISKLGNGTVVRARYNPETPFVGNVSLIVHFDKSVTMGSAAIP
jgi:hypothetical protein